MYKQRDILLIPIPLDVKYKNSCKDEFFYWNFDAKSLEIR
ncbi:hypothetical protein J2Z80_002593 [Thermoanaerobacterium butyriciformans]|uniref:Uncharacterized protein n=1 Tax=Thermoanaerobacterium butyriciformans TaxID=1702242 RepID=A0ABS4NH93_9THEO|nr:hypothetical protein [Thermoanaerobacterium butyriciformans]